MLHWYNHDDENLSNNITVLSVTVLQMALGYKSNVRFIGLSKGTPESFLLNSPLDSAC